MQKARHFHRQPVTAEHVNAKEVATPLQRRVSREHAATLASKWGVEVDCENSLHLRFGPDHFVVGSHSPQRWFLDVLRPLPSPPSSGSFTPPPIIVSSAWGPTNWPGAAASASPQPSASSSSPTLFRDVSVAQAVRFASHAQNSRPGWVHGGCVAACFDLALVVAAGGGPTAYLTVKFHHPTRLHRLYVLVARVLRREGGEDSREDKALKMFMVGQLVDAESGQVCASAEGLFLPRRSLMRQLTANFFLKIPSKLAPCALPSQLEFRGWGQRGGRVGGESAKERERTSRRADRLSGLLQRVGGGFKGYQTVSAGLFGPLHYMVGEASDVLWKFALALPLEPVEPQPVTAAKPISSTHFFLVTFGLGAINMGTGVHGGALASMFDHCCAWAQFLATHEHAVTLSLDVQFRHPGTILEPYVVQMDASEEAAGRMAMCGRMVNEGGVLIGECTAVFVRKPVSSSL